MSEAAGLGDQIGEGRNLRQTSFGPMNVLFYRLGSATALGEPDRAVRLARRIDPGALPHVERRVRYWLDVARALSAAGLDGPALQALLQAERAAPQEVRSRDTTQELVVHLLGTSRRIDVAALRSLARRVGVAA